MASISNMLKNIPLNPIRFLTPIIEQKEKEGVNFYKLNIGQPDLEVDEYISNYFINIESCKHIEYTNSQGILELRDAWANGYYEGKFSPDGVLITNGSSEGMLFLTLALMDIGEYNLTFSPIYPNYESFSYITGRKIVSIPRNSKNGYKLPSENEIIKVLENNNKIKVITIISPDNPTGYVMTQDEIEMVFNLSEKYDLWVVIDEAYRDIRFTNSSVAVSDYVCKNEKWMNRAIFLSSTSKEYSACGLRVGAVVSKNVELIKDMVKLAMPRLSVNEIAQKAAINALKLQRMSRVKVCKEYKKRRDIVVNAFKNMGLNVVTPEGALYILPDLAPLGILNTLEFSKWMVEQYFSLSSDGKKESVVVTPGSGFYPVDDFSKIDSLIRIAYVIGEDKLRRAMDILEQGIKLFINK